MDHKSNYYPESAKDLSPESQFTLKKISISIRSMTHEQLITYFLDTMVIFLRLKSETNKLLVIAKKSKQLSMDTLASYKKCLSRTNSIK